MARSRTAAAVLLQQMESSSRPIYLLDDRQAIVFCNAACAAWCGLPTDALLGQICHYHGGEGASAATAACWLCPPPDRLTDPGGRGYVCSVDSAGQLARRGGVFLPLGDPIAGGAVLAVLDADDVATVADGPAVAMADDEPTSERLHAELLRFRGQFAGRYGFERLVGNSPAATCARAQVLLAGAGSATVLIIGPRGSGREHVAKAIHFRQSREIGTIVPLDCAVLEAELLVSTLRGLLGRPLLRRPDLPSTVLLTEVDQMPSEVQVQLAALLRSNASDLRILSTASRRLTELVGRDQFRADLAAQLSTLVIELPPLAQRREDLPLLAQMFLEEANVRGGRQLAGLTPEALDQLAGYSWPRNLDELAELVDEAHAQAAGSEITPRDLPKRIHLAADAARHPPRAVEPIDLERVLSGVETELITRALTRAKGNKTRAAELLGLSRPRLYRRLVQLGLESASELPDFEETPGPPPADSSASPGNPRT